MPANIMNTLRGWISDRLADADPRLALVQLSAVAVEQRRVLDACVADGNWPNNVDQSDYTACVAALEDAVVRLRDRIIKADAAAVAAATVAAAIRNAEARTAAIASLRSLLPAPPVTGGVKPSKAG